VQSSIPVIIPTLDGRVDGVFWPGNARQRPGGLIVFFDAESGKAAARQVLTHLRALCQQDGISVLEMSHVRPKTHTRVADSDRDALDLLAGVSYLRSHGISDIAVIFCSGRALHASPQEVQAELLTRCIKAILATSTDWSDLTEQLATLTDSVRSATDCIRGLTRVSVLWDDSNPQAGGSDGNTISSSVRAFSAATAGRKTLRLADALYNWTLETLYRHANSSWSPAVRRPNLGSANQSLPERSASDAWIKMSYLRAESAHARNIARQNLTFLEHQWDAMLEGLDERNRIRADNVRHLMAHVVSAQKSIATYGDSRATAKVLQAVRNSWQFLDRPARENWLKAWTQVFPFGGLGQTHPSLPAGSRISPR
jgi:hypothetical protein